jgi:HK97 gp10 family phage protein
LDVKWTIKIDTEQLKASVRNAIYLGTLETYSQYITPRAQELSPYLTGNNARTITHEVTKVPGGVTAELYTQSGYGGYLEIGTKKMHARPYLYTAFAQFSGKLKAIIGEKIRFVKKLTGGLEIQ